MKYKHPRDVFIMPSDELREIRVAIEQAIEMTVGRTPRNIELDVASLYYALSEAAKNLLVDELDASGWRLDVHRSSTPNHGTLYLCPVLNN